MACRNAFSQSVAVPGPFITLLALRVRNTRERAVRSRARIAGVRLFADHFVALAALTRRVLTSEDDVVDQRGDEACPRT
jgi:hypothetical protein